MSTNSGAATSWMLGINLSGAEYGDPYTGRMYWDYIYPSNAELDHYAARGATVIRLPLSLERLAPVPGGGLDQGQLAFVDGLVAHAASIGLKIILDPHNFGYAYGTQIGTTAASNDSFAAFWSKLATHYAGTPNVIFGLMNEPHDQSAEQWLVTANMAIASIRAAGATMQQILVPGTWWDTGDTWIQSRSASVLGGGIVDPARNFAFEVHQYFDGNSSGTHNAVVSATIGVERLTSVTNWAQSTGNRLFLGEFGVGSDTLSLQALANTLAYMQRHTDVWQGGTYWASGPWMGDYMFSAETPSGADTPQMTTLARFMSLPGRTPAVTTLPYLTVTPTSNDAGLPTIGIHRFFDKAHGTQFLTASLDEVDTIIRTRADLAYEGLAMAAIASGSSDPNAVSVYRYFDTRDGTHFFTASQGERAHIDATRPDLVREQASFYEHATQQPGDLPVYRFFNTQTGNHFFTSSAAERASITSNRPDMTAEGIAFYAPSLA